MERSRLTYETTNQQLLTLIAKLSSQLSRAKITHEPKQHQAHQHQVLTSPKPSKEAPSTPGSSFRRQKAIRIKKRDSVKRKVSMSSQNKIECQSYMSSDSGNFSDNDNANVSSETRVGNKGNHLQQLVSKGLDLVSDVNSELETKVRNERVVYIQTLFFLVFGH